MTLYGQRKRIVERYWRMVWRFDVRGLTIETPLGPIRFNGI